MTNATAIPSFEQITSWKPLGDQRYEGLIHPEWTQGRGAYGGILAASAVRAMKAAVAPERELRHIDVRFMGAVLPDEPAVMSVTLERESKRISHLRAVIAQSGGNACAVGATFATARESKVTIEAPTRPEGIPSPEAIRDMPYIKGVVPAAIQHMDMRWTSGLPFSGSGEAVCEGWCTFRNGVEDGAVGIVGLLDAFPPPVLPMLKRPAPASSVTWSAQLAHLPERFPEGYFFYRSRAVDSRDGYVRMRAEMWLPDGRLCASTEQLMAVYA